MNGCATEFGDWGNTHNYADYTFNATGVGQKNILTVTGDVLLRVFGICKTAVVTVGVGTCSLGVASSVAAILPVTVGDNLIANEIWHDPTPDSTIENLSVARAVIISNGNDVTLDLLLATFASGVIRFYYSWLPLSSDGNVVNA
jgi:hypothetical protein